MDAFLNQVLSLTECPMSFSVSLLKLDGVISIRTAWRLLTSSEFGTYLERVEELRDSRAQESRVESSELGANTGRGNGKSTKLS